MAHILAVDDERDLGQVIKLILEFAGHHVEVAYNGQEGLDSIAHALPDLILLDVEMPILNGPDMAHRLIVRDAGSERIPIIVVSGVADVAAVAHSIGTPYFLEKPMVTDRLLAMVDRALRERRWPQPEWGNGNACA